MQTDKSGLDTIFSIRWITALGALAMLHHQFEKELTHLEAIFPSLAGGRGPFALSYWRSRATALLTYQSVIPSGARRIIWLLDMLDKIEQQTRIAPSPLRRIYSHAKTGAGSQGHQPF
ncbi:hypothetical protein [Burkholderia sp. WAC0059]|uniref:hypothetical protein n=1 Tax=Burkholderia sp. WAC0059 TaxID=2066022 RepID=UPI0015E0C416|nr:hypothetical protein [Burkholderia sp. WAC0059]